MYAKFLVRICNRVTPLVFVSHPKIGVHIRISKHFLINLERNCSFVQNLQKSIFIKFNYFFFLSSFSWFSFCFIFFLHLCFLFCSFLFSCFCFLSCSFLFSCFCFLSASLFFPVSVFLSCSFVFSCFCFFILHLPVFLFVLSTLILSVFFPAPFCFPDSVIYPHPLCFLSCSFLFSCFCYLP